MTEEEDKKIADEKAQEEAKQKAEAETADKAGADAAEKARAENEDQKSPLEEARELDKSIKEGIVEKKKLLDREEKLQADAQIAGKGFAAPPQVPQRTPEQIASREKIKAYGQSTGSQWAKDMETQDAKR